MKLMPTMYLKSHQLYDKITEILVENKGTILFKTSWFTNLDILVTSDPANVQHVLNSNYSIYQRGSEFRKAFDFLGPAAFTKDLHEWREDKKFTHAFYKEIKFHKSTPKIIHHTLENGLLPVLDHVSQQNQVLDLQNLFNRYMLDATCLSATGFDLGSLRVDFPKAPLLDAMVLGARRRGRVFRHILPERVWRMQKWLRIGKEKKLAEAYIVVDQILGDYVSRKRIAAKNQETGDDFDVLKFYLAEAGGGSKGSKKHAEKGFLVANIATLLFAGRDTSAGLLTWFFYLIFKNPLVENKILEEIRQFSPPQKYLFSKVEELSKLVYLHSVLIESLRLYPTVPVIIRDPAKEDVLPSGHKVDQTTKVFLCTYAMGGCRRFGVKIATNLSRRDGYLGKNKSNMWLPTFFLHSDTRMQTRAQASETDSQAANYRAGNWQEERPPGRREDNPPSPGRASSAPLKVSLPAKEVCLTRESL
ncbi:hypothetical protein DH2020_015695 [Rehmannia glutinosa]|uniref:Cytochrome P450 protein n=1 Tax=Rehmannia glutinosa TaxID=99300 RepID=A0ABR0WTD1_REHGL